MANFKLYESKLQAAEGTGYSNKPTDLGGATTSGITWTTYKMFFPNKTFEQFKAIPYEDWYYVMKNGFWDRCWADQILNQSVAEIFVDWTINSGWGKIKDVQRIVGVKEDGIVGPKTITAINSCNQRALHYLIKKARQLHYHKCVDGNRDLDPRASILPTNIANFDGWCNRLDKFMFKK